MAALLELIPATRISVKYPDGSYKSERHFLDFVVSGQSLWEKVGKPRDMVSVFCHEYAREETIKAANRLLLTENANLPADRRSLFICSECGDIGCGAITALVVRDGHSIVWKTFGYENNYEENILLDDYKQLGPFTFDLQHYERTLLKAIESLDDFRVNRT
jgi:hypothetical protein